MRHMNHDHLYQTRSKRLKISKERKSELLKVVDCLSPLHIHASHHHQHQRQQRTLPKVGDWLSQNKEEGQTLVEYIDGIPVLATSQRNTIVILPLGDDFFDQDDDCDDERTAQSSQSEHLQRILNNTKEFLSIFYGLEVHVEDPVPLSNVPQRAQRIQPSWGDQQILTTWILNELLSPRLPSNAATYLCLTTSDLWPGGKGWNFVFGEASLRNRVGVWSLYRKGLPQKMKKKNDTQERRQRKQKRMRMAAGDNVGDDDDDVLFRTCLRRVLQTAVHEIGHMFGMEHCIACGPTQNGCGMCGSNSLDESDKLPLHFCHECTPKIALATGVDLIDRAQKLEEFLARQGLKEEAKYYQQSANKLRYSSLNKGNNDGNDSHPQRNAFRPNSQKLTGQEHA